jgi:hypothetical protein
LSREEQKAYEQEHVDLMLDIAGRYRMRRLEGFRLMAPQGAYERFWVLGFPDLAGAEAWIEAEMAPPYGRYGYYEYYLARSGLPEYCADWAKGMPAPTPLVGDPHQVPALDVDADSVVAVLFERGEQAAGEKPVTEAYVETMGDFCKAHGLLRLECFKLIAPQADWHRVWLAEFPAVESVEAWIQVEKGRAHGHFAERSFALTRKWAPAYFASWIPKEEA